MASKDPKAPVCPDCSRSNGVSTEVSASIVWRNGAWRYAYDADAVTEHPGHYYCEACGHAWRGDDEV